MRGCEGEGMSEMIGLLSPLARRLEEIEENERHICFASSLKYRDLFRVSMNAIVAAVDNRGNPQLADDGIWKVVRVQNM